MTAQRPIVLSTLNARYYHSALGLRCIQANLRELREQAAIAEFVVGRPTAEIVASLLALGPRILMFGVYIWNVDATLRLMLALRAAAPDVTLVLGGPEVSYPPLYPGLAEAVDYVITGEGEVAAYELCAALLAGQPPARKFIVGPQADVETMVLPYTLYTDEDVRSRMVYVETSRGCPYRCEYCLSSLDREVRFFPIDALLAEFGKLLDRGVLLFKLLDRTFNTKIDRAVRILEFFLERHREGLVIHCELVPDRLPPALKDCFRRFPPGVLQFEVGVQTFNQEVLDRIQRAQRADRVMEHLTWLCEESGADIHADLIFGLPGDTLGWMKESFNRLVPLGAAQIQINLLKLLKGTPISRHTQTFGMVYDTAPPFEILETSTLDRATLRDLADFARVWTLFHNSEKLKTSLPFVWRGADNAFDAFMAFAKYVKRQAGRLHGLDFIEQTRLLDEWLTVHADGPQRARQALLADYQDGGRRRIPPALRRE